MNQLKRVFVWLARIHRCRGFGIQSPTDYRFVRYVVNEHLPYYAYDQLDSGNWLRTKLGCLYLRIANWRQPAMIVDRVGVSDYLHAGCKRAVIGNDGSSIDMACTDITDDYRQLLSRCNEGAVIVFEHIWQHKKRWHLIEQAPRVAVSYDLYYCGVVIIGCRQARQSYIVNF